MSRTLLCLFAALSFAAPAGGQESDAQTYLLRYKMEAGETIRWEVLHEVEFDTTVQGTTQRARTYSKSVKAWRVIDKARTTEKYTFQHLVEQVHMWQELTGRARVEWKGPSEDPIPPGFESVAATLGKPLYVIQLDPQGNIINRNVQHTGKGLDEVSEDREITMPMPKEAIPVGHVWHLKFDFRVADDSGRVKKFEARDQFKLLSVKDGIARISTETQILTPVRDPAIEAQILQRGGHGEIEFDIEAGRIVAQKMDIDKNVIGFRGPASSIHYKSRFVEKLLPATKRTASKK